MIKIIKKLIEMAEELIEAAMGLMSKNKRSKKDSEIIAKIIDNFRENIHTIDDLESASAMFLVRGNGEIIENKLSPSQIKSPLGDMMINAFIRKAKEENDEVKLVIKAFFGRGIIEKTENKDGVKKLKEISEKISNNEELTFEEEELVKNFMMVEVYDKKALNINVFEYITDVDRIDKKTYVCINPNKNIDEFISYKDNSNVVNYFK